MYDIWADKTSEDQVVEALAKYDELPFFPLCGSDFQPGPDFVAHALALGDPKPKLERHGSRKSSHKCMVACGPILPRLYRNAVFDQHFFLPVKVKGRRVTAATVPGHLWGKQHPVAGPRDLAGVDVMIIGKCLGRQEVCARRNLVGESGDTLMQILRECGVKPEEYESWYVTNLVKHELLDPSSSRLAAAWVKNFAPVLEQELKLLRPKFVLCLGSEVSKWLMDGDVAGGVSASHGRVLTKKIDVTGPDDTEPVFHEFSYMTCMHPAALSHGSGDKRPELVGTVRRFVQLVHGELKTEEEEKPDHAVIWTEEELAKVIDDVIAEHKAGASAGQPIAIDCEWHGEFWSSCDRPLRGLLPDGKRSVPESKGEKESWLRTIQFSHKPGFARCIVLRHGGERHPEGDDRVGLPAFVPGIAAAVRQLKRLVTPTSQRPVRIIGHNLRADLPWLTKLDAELGKILTDGFEAPADDVEPDGSNRLFGWQKARVLGGFDTLYAAHSVQETAERKLEIVGMNLCGVRRYDGAVLAAKKELCDRLDIKPSKLQGYGEIPDEVLFPYGCWDCDTTMRIYCEMVKPGGHLDSDQYGRSSWKPFWLSQRKMTAELEMEMEGLLIDYKRAENLTAIYAEARGGIVESLEELIGWSGFNPQSSQQTRCVLFGPEMAGKVDGETGDWVDPRPDHAKECRILNMVPVKTTGKPSKDWLRVVSRRQENQFTPACDKETLGILLYRAMARDDATSRDIISNLRNFRFINRVLTGTFCPPDAEDGVQYDEDGDMVFDKGFMACVEWDRRVRTHFLPIETGRISSARPNVTNLSKRREKDLKGILKSRYVYPQRSIICSRPGYVLITADFTGAELLMMAIQSGSKKMVEHCLRANLPESHQDHYDIHSNVAKAAFRFDARPTKSALKEADLEHFRDIAKTLSFGLAYGRGDEAVVRAIEELNIKVTLDDVAGVRAVLFGNYPELESFFPRCWDRVTKPGYIATCFGRMRRAQTADLSEEGIAELKRQFGNMPIQGGVADCTTIALHNMRHYPNRNLPNGLKKYYLVGQFHDAIMSEVKEEYAEWYVREVLPACMRDGVTIYACDLDGNRLPGREGYHLGYDYEIGTHWGDKISEDLSTRLGLGKDGKFPETVAD